jgi:hypothetical protein
MSLDFAKTCPWLLETPAMSHCPFTLLGHMPHHLCRTALCGKNTRQSGPSIDTDTRVYRKRTYIYMPLQCYGYTRQQSLHLKTEDENSLANETWGWESAGRVLRCKHVHKQDISLSIGSKSTRCKLFHKQFLSEHIRCKLFHKQYTSLSINCKNIRDANSFPNSLYLRTKDVNPFTNNTRVWVSAGRAWDENSFTNSFVAENKRCKPLSQTIHEFEYGWKNTRDAKTLSQAQT